MEQKKQEEQGEEQVVTPFDVQGKGKKIDYGHLVKNFGTNLLTEDLIARLKGVTGVQPH